MRYLIRTFFSLILILAVTSALLPNRYTLEKTITSHCQQKHIEELLLDIANWQLWTPWRTYQKQWKELELANSNKIGAYLKWQNGDHIGELTVTSLSKNHIAYLSVIDQHTSNGKISTTAFADKLQLTWSIEGGINTFFIGSLMTYYHKHKMQSAIDLGLRNLNSLCKTQS